MSNDNGWPEGWDWGKAARRARKAENDRSAHHEYKHDIRMLRNEFVELFNKLSIAYIYAHNTLIIISLYDYIS